MARYDLEFSELARWMELARASEFRATRLAALCGVSTRQLSRYCHSRFGRSTQSWLKEQRMVLAGDLLCELRCVKAASFQLGFKQTSHFCREFKTFYQLTPTAYLMSVMSWAVAGTLAGMQNQCVPEQRRRIL